MVTLGDVADVFAADTAEAERIGSIELFPSPAAGRERFVRARELHDLLLLRGLNLADHRFSGASQITVAGSGAVAAASGQGPPTMVHKRRAESRITEALKAHLMARVSAETPWLVEVNLPESLIRALADPAAELRVEGGQPPWLGLQQFELSLATPEGPQQAVVDANVSIPASVVVAAKSISRGALLRAGDLQLSHAESPLEQPGALYSLDQAIGKETTRAIPAGKILTADAVQAPVYVRRGEIVTVYAHAAGIRVRTQGRARDDGSNGALVAVESLDTRETFFARVCGVREVEVFARAARASDAAAGAAVRR
jgi:flagella basal body P-ring formation protein FlgA